MKLSEGEKRVRWTNILELGQLEISTDFWATGDFPLHRHKCTSQLANASAGSIM